MKKVLVVLLAVAMLFCFSATAMAATYTDSASMDATTANAVDKVSALGIMDGYPDGSFQDQGTITRAEFAKIAVGAAGLSEAAELLTNQASSYSDVKAGAWYTGYINLASARNYVKGYPDGTFRPNAPITQQEVITVYLRLLGYDEAKLVGPWPVDMIAKATDLELLDNVTFLGSVNATRGFAAIVLNDCLEEGLVKWDKDTESYVEDCYTNSTYQKTMIGEMLKADKSALTYTNGWEVKDFEDRTFSLSTTSAGTFVADESTVYTNGYSINSLGDSQVYVYYTVDKDTKDKEAKYVQVESEKIIGTKVEVVSGSDNKVKVSGAKTYTFQSGYTADIAAINNSKNSTVTVYVDKDGYVYKMSADSTNTDRTVIVSKYNESGVIDTYYKAAAAGNLNLKSKDVIVLKDGKEVELSSLAKYDVLSVFRDKGDADAVIFVSSYAEGAFGRYYANGKMQLAGTDRVVNSQADFREPGSDNKAVSLSDKYVGQTVKYVLNAKNEVVGVQFTDAVSNSFFAVVTGVTLDGSAIGVTTSGNRVKEMTVFKEDGTKVTYTVEEDTDLYSIATSGGTVGIGTVAKVTIDKNSEITGFEVVDTYAGVTDGTTKAEAELNDAKTYILLNGSYKKLASDFVGFNIVTEDHATADTYKVKTADLELITADEILGGDVVAEKSAKTIAETGYVTTLNDQAKIMGYATNTSNEVTCLWVANYASASKTYKYGIVDKKWTNDGDYFVTFKADSTEYEVNAANYANLVVGDLVEYTLSDSKVTFKKIIVDASVTSDVYTTFQDSLDSDYSPVAFKMITQINGTLITLDGGAQFTVDEHTVILEKDGSTWTTYENTTSPLVKNVSKVTAMKHDTKGYATFVFVDTANDAGTSSSSSSTVNSNVMLLGNVNNGASVTVGSVAYTNSTGVELAAGWYTVTIENTNEIIAATAVNLGIQSTDVTVIAKTANTISYVVTGSVTATPNFASDVKVYNKSTGFMGTLADVTVGATVKVTLDDNGAVSVIELQ